MSKKLNFALSDEALLDVVGGVGVDDDSKYKIGDIVYITYNMTPIGSDGGGEVKVITTQGKIISEAYKDFHGFECYDVEIIAQEVIIDGYPNTVGTIARAVQVRVLKGAAKRVAENGITF